MVLGFIFEGVAGHDALVAIAAGNAVANKLDGALRQGRWRQQTAPWVQDKATEVGLQVVAFDDVHQPQGVRTLRQGGGNGHHGVFLTHQADLKRFGIVHLGHEVAALGLGP